jgi:hypothetical protein
MRYSIARNMENWRINPIIIIIIIYNYIYYIYLFDIYARRIIERMIGE